MSSVYPVPPTKENMTSHPHQIPTLPPILLPQRPHIPIISVLIRPPRRPSTISFIGTQPVGKWRAVSIPIPTIVIRFVLLANPPQRLLEAVGKVVNLPGEGYLVPLLCRCRSIRSGVLPWIAVVGVSGAGDPIGGRIRVVHAGSAHVGVGGGSAGGEIGGEGRGR